MIQVKNLSFAYPDGTPALSNINLSIHPKSCVAIIGANGAGKSTLLSLLVGIQTPGIGEIEIEGMPLNKPNLQEIRKRVGFVFQNPDDQLFMTRVIDDIAFAPKNFGFTPEATQSTITQILEDLKIEHLKDRLSHKLSGGEKRSVAIAGVLAAKPHLLLLDEPSSYLDPKGRRNLIQLLKRLPQTKVIATHDLDLVLDLCDRVILLRKGALLADGPPRPLFENQDLMEAAGLEAPLSFKKGHRQ